MLATKGVTVEDIGYIPVLVGTSDDLKTLTSLSIGDYSSLSNTLYGEEKYKRIRR
jgi:hypothetical protein